MLQSLFSKLRERVTQLDMENTALSRAASLTPEKPECDEENLEAEQLLDKIMHFRSLLKAAVEKSEKDINLSSEIVMQEFVITALDHHHHHHHHCRILLFSSFGSFFLSPVVMLEFAKNRIGSSSYYSLPPSSFASFFLSLKFPFSLSIF